MMNKSLKRLLCKWLAVPAGVALAVIAVGCQSIGAVGELGAALGQATGAITPEQADSLVKTSKAVAKSFEDITPEQEYYIGRSVAATLLSSYAPYDNRAVNEYVNLVGQTLAQFSDKPETFGGYHFLVLDSDEINAFAAPGGLILLTRGMLRCCRTEDALAAVLAHEIGHVQLAHGLRAIKTSRITDAWTILGTEAAKSLGGDALAQLTTAFEGSISDVTSTLTNSGYSRKLEREADQAAIEILNRAGYDPAALVDMLRMMGERLQPGGNDFAKTHPDPADRIRDIEEVLGTTSAAAVNPSRQSRFSGFSKQI